MSTKSNQQGYTAGESQMEPDGCTYLSILDPDGDWIISLCKQGSHSQEEMELYAEGLLTHLNRNL